MDMVIAIGIALVMIVGLAYLIVETFNTDIIE